MPLIFKKVWVELLAAGLGQAEVRAVTARHPAEGEAQEVGSKGAEGYAGLPEDPGGDTAS